MSHSTAGPGIVHIQALPLSQEHLCISVEDITAQKKAEQSLRQLAMHEEMICSQQAMLAERSTPLIPLSEYVTVMPVIGAIDSARAQQVFATLLEGVSSSRARIAIGDITGVPLVDSQIASVLIQAVQAVTLLGA